LWMPGVSRKAIWPRASLKMPTMRLRVVCGFGETMATFWPRMRLSSVDLPALGRPTRATTPNFELLDRGIVRVPFRIARDAHAIDAAAVGAVDGEDVAARSDRRARFRDASQAGEDQAGHGLVILAGELRVEHLFERVDAQLPADEVLAVAEVDDGRLFLLVLV